MTHTVSCLGDNSSHGGHVTTVSSFSTIGGVKITLDQDLHTCPIEGHGITPITATSAILKESGKKVVRAGDMAGCGAIIEPIQTFVKSD